MLRWGGRSCRRWGWARPRGAGRTPDAASRPCCCPAGHRARARWVGSGATPGVPPRNARSPSSVMVEGLGSAFLRGHPRIVPLLRFVGGCLPVGAGVGGADRPPPSALRGRLPAGGGCCGMRRARVLQGARDVAGEGQRFRGRGDVVGEGQRFQGRGELREEPLWRGDRERHRKRQSGAKGARGTARSGPTGGRSRTPPRVAARSAEGHGGTRRGVRGAAAAGGRRRCARGARRGSPGWEAGGRPGRRGRACG